ncbi:MAG: KH domain-containing protein, partial [Desulfovibrio sp.]|nr:KH domain-containing protein [Desulfovibrio sp.]
EVENWEEDQEKNLTIIHAIIYVARPMYKAMIIGKSGSMIKEIGTEARKDIEELIGTRVHLELWVKVREDWPNDPAFVNNLNQNSNPV